MKVLVTDLFLNSIPSGKEEYVLDKLTLFVREYKKSKFDMSAVPLGFSVREIKGNKYHRIFKLRINKGDRILYTFRPDRLRNEFKDAIIFLNYCHHDKQILRGKQIKLKPLDWLALDEEEEAFEQELDVAYEAFDYDPNVIITHVVNVETMRDFAQRRNEKAIYYLNDEQYGCLQTHGTPTFIFGSAGSGKTTINIHKAYLLAQEHLKIGYFTYSNYLVQDAVKHFQKIQIEYDTPFTSEQSKRVEFQHFNTYLGYVTQKHQVVHYEQFRKWMIENQPSLLKLSNLSPYDIWKEIRGLIKGMIPKEWLDYRFDLANLNVSREVVENIVLKKLGIIQDGVLYLNAQRIYEAKKHYMDAVTLNAVGLMQRYLEQYMIEHSLIDRETYLILDEQYCQYDQKVRTIIYEVAQKYQVWLAHEKKIDENDLARHFLKALVQQEVKRYDYVIADEIQDLTEIQIYCLLLLVKNRNNILFSGDYNQTIRPTYFNTGRIESLLKTSNLHGDFEKHLLLRNYRSSENIVALANDIVKLRIETFGRYKSNDYIEEAVRPFANPVTYLNPTPQNIQALLQTAIKRHYVGIVVPDRDQKAKLEAWLGCKGALFTVEEIKGIEKDYIICYNIMSTHHVAWEQIMSGCKKMDQKERYYFNLLYVALTRARHQLCFIEEKMPPNLYKKIQKNFEFIPEFDEVSMKLNELSTDNQFYKEAQMYERRELYEQAIAAYIRCGLEEALVDIKRCNALQKATLGNYYEAGLELMKIKEYERAGQFFLQGEDYLLYLKALVYANESFEMIEAIFSDFGISVIPFVLNQPKKVTWLKRFNAIYIKHITKQMKVADEIIAHIEEMK